MTSATAIRSWTHEPLLPEVRKALARISRVADVAVVAAMPDVHLAKAVCVGAVVGARTSLFPDAVGGDIGCGMAAVRLDCSADVLASRKTAAQVLRMLGQRIPTSSHRSADALLPEHLARRQLSSLTLERKKASVGRVQFATLGCDESAARVDSYRAAVVAGPGLQGDIEHGRPVAELAATGCPHPRLGAQPWPRRVHTPVHTQRSQHEASTKRPGTLSPRVDC